MNFFRKLKELKNFDDAISEKSKELDLLNEQITQQNSSLSSLKMKVQQISAEKEEIQLQRNTEIEKTKKACEDTIKSYEDKRNDTKALYDDIQLKYDDALKELSQTNAEIELNKEKIKLIKLFIKKSLKDISADTSLDEGELNTLCPSIELHLNSFDVKDLRSLIKENQKLTDALLSKYDARYTTKSNKAIYNLMVLALRAELQNILIDLKYSNIDKCKENLNKMIDKFMCIASDGNQQIAPTIKTFIGEIRILFEQCIDIEYTYFVRKEQEKAEQQALKEQMRQEAEERKALEQEQKKVEKEESKYKTEISNTEELLASCEDDEKTKQLLARIKELKGLLSKVEEKKEEIINRQNGKAGYVYVISNLGSFGDTRFKIGMTRRFEPMDRIKELGDASVPFSFDVHSFIFSDDAVGLESELHTRLNDKRTNKINLRKEFFDISIDELEALVDEICPTAEFKRTMLAIEYRKGLELLN